MKVQAHLLPIDSCLFDSHVIKGFYVGVEMEHYFCFKIFIPSTVRVCIYDIVRWFPRGSLKLPIPSKDELLCITIDDLRTTLQLSVKNNILPTEGNTSRKTLLNLNEILKNRDPRDPTNKPPTPTEVLRVIVQSKDPTIFLRV